MMEKYPEYIDYAFRAIGVISTEEWVEQDIIAFRQRWGYVDLEICEHVLRQGHGEDQMVAAFAIGQTRSRWARNLLLPFLHSEDPGVRWASALSLGEMKEELAKPMLIQMLQEYLPPPYTPVGEVGPDWFEVQHLHVASLLGGWGDPSMISPLRETLARLWQVERDAPENINQTGKHMWWDYQDQLAYALGQLAAFVSLRDLEVPVDRSRVWTVNLVLGYLNVQQRYRTNCLGFLGDPIHAEDYRELSPLILRVLQQQLGLSRQEAASLLQGYGQDYFCR